MPSIEEENKKKHDSASRVCGCLFSHLGAGRSGEVAVKGTVSSSRTAISIPQCSAVEKPLGEAVRRKYFAKVYSGMKRTTEKMAKSAVALGVNEWIRRRCCRRCLIAKSLGLSCFCPFGPFIGCEGEGGVSGLWTGVTRTRGHATPTLVIC